MKNSVIEYRLRWMCDPLRFPMIVENFGINFFNRNESGWLRRARKGQQDEQKAE